MVLFANQTSTSGFPSLLKSFAKTSPKVVPLARLGENEEVGCCRNVPSPLPRKTVKPSETELKSGEFPGSAEATTKSSLPYLLKFTEVQEPRTNMWLER